VTRSKNDLFTIHFKLDGDEENISSEEYLLIEAQLNDLLLDLMKHLETGEE